MKWQPIETAPTDGTRILLRGRNGKIADGYYGQPDGLFANPKRFVWPYIHANPTHWAPLALIAAAPELLDAAMKVNALSIQTDAHKELRAAIANATGDDDAAPERWALLWGADANVRGRAMKCERCGSDTRIQVQAVISAPGELAHQFSKQNLRRKDVYLMGVLWETADFICTNPECGKVLDGYGNYVTSLKKEVERLKSKYEPETPNANVTGLAPEKGNEE